jgi:ABC-type proline/glycine betaine transport system permease subunit
VDTRFADAWARLPDYLGNHVLVSVTALVLGLALSFPLALASLRRPRMRALLLAATSIVQTVPGLALLALFYPLLLGMAALVSVLQLAVIYIPSVAAFFSVTPLSLPDLLIALGSGVLVMTVIEVVKIVEHARKS